MKNSKKKGFTLIEIILSLAIFALISVGFLGMFSTVFINTYRSTEVTENAFFAQQQIEDQIADVKRDLENNVTPTGLTSSTVSLFSGTSERNVVVYKLTQDITASSSLETILAQSRPPLLQTPSITGGVTIAVFSGSDEVEYPNIGMSDLSVDLGEELEVDNPGILIRYLYYWYISNPGFYVASAPPTFPDDYEIIPDHVSRLIPTVPSSYAGRFLKLVVTPVGEKGKMGTSVESNAVYISKMPLNTNLVLHLDANYIDKDDTSQVRTVTNGSIVTNFITKWNDLSSQNSPLVQTTMSAQPILHQLTLGTETNLRDIQGVLGNASGSGFNLKQGTSPTIGSFNDMTVYFVAKFDDALPSSFTIFQSRASAATSGNKWLLMTDDEDQLVLTRYLGSMTTANTKSVVGTSLDYRDSNWRIFKLNIWRNHLSIEVNNTVIGTFDYTSTSATMQLSEFKINFNSNLTIGEVLMYGTAHASNSTEATAIYQYLSEKYLPTN